MLGGKELRMWGEPLWTYLDNLDCLPELSAVLIYNQEEAAGSSRGVFGVFAVESLK
jgi:hypothetical protein